MIEIKFILFAKSASIDYANTQLSIFNIFEELKAPMLPSFLFESCLVALFVRHIKKDNNAPIVKFRFSVNKKIKGEQELLIDFKNVGRTRLILNIPTLQFDEFGTLKFEFFLKSKLLGSHELNIIKSENDTGVNLPDIVTSKSAKAKPKK